MDALREPLGERAARAVGWRLTTAAIGAGAQFTIGVLLARLLTPDDFGLLALAVVVLGVARLFGDLGIGSAIVQRLTLTERHVRTAFTFSVLLGSVVAAVMLLAAPLGGILMQDDRVTSILRVLSLSFAIGGPAVVAGALLRRDLDFRTQFFIEASSYTFGYGAVSILLALLGYGVWSLVWGGLCQVLLASTVQLLVVRHSVRPLLAKAELLDLLNFGVITHLSGCVNYAALNGDNFIVGRLLGAASLGLYARAYNLMNLPYTYAASLVSSVLFPAFARLQGEGERLARGYLLVTELTALIAAPAMATMAIVAPHLVRTLYGPQWEGVVPPLQILCGAGYFRALYHLDGVVTRSVGRVYEELWRQAAYAALVVGAAIAGARFGLVGIAAGVTVAIIYMFIAMGQLALDATKLAWREYWRAQRSAALLASATAACALAARLSMEAAGLSSPWIALGTLTAAALPWTWGMLWCLGQPRLAPVWNRIPTSFQRLVARISSRARTPEATMGSGSPIP
jgi:PST family polysaccharide transporter